MTWIAIAIVAVIIILGGGYYYSREHYGVCTDCTGKQLKPFGAVINPFIWPFSASADIDRLRRESAAPSESFAAGPIVRPTHTMYHSFAPDHPPAEGYHL